MATTMVELENDVLTLRIPKPETPRPSRIEVQATNGSRQSAQPTST